MFRLGYIINPTADLVWFLGLPFLGVAFALACHQWLPAVAAASIGLWVTIPHHWVTWLRTYGLSEDWQRWKPQLIAGPLVIFGMALLGLFAVPMLAIALAVHLYGGAGPVIFRQERMSLNGQRFKIFKFRTMRHVDAERQALRDAGKGTEAWTTPGDERITGVGRFLRRTSLDELPQLFNVILGEMSLVGPRPERPELIERFREDWRGYMLRQNVKAGITGWAQVNGLRGETSLRKRLQYDLFYIRNWSVSFDLRILWMTIFRGFVHPSAH